MAYIGSQPTVGLVTKLSDIASSFNGILTTFQLSIPPGGAGNSFTPGSAFQIIVSLGGVIQNPATDYTLSGSQITFTTAPAAGLTCFIIALGQSINVGTPGAGTVTTSSFGTLTSIPLTGATSGTTTIQAPAVAGNNTLTLPTSNGSANQFLKNGATAGSLGYSSMVEDSSGRLLVGTSSARSNFYNGSLSTGLQVEGLGTARRVSVIGDDGGGFIVLGYQASGAVGGNTLVSNTNSLGGISFQGNDGTEFVEAAAIECSVDGTPGANDMPGRLVFSTTADGASSPTERMRITNGGLFKVQTQGASYENATGGVNEISGSINDTLLLLRNTSGTINGTTGGLDIFYQATDPNSTTAKPIQFKAGVGGTVRFEVRSNGGIGNFSANNANLSDRNAKKDISPAAGTWSCLKEWEIVNYRYKDQPDDAGLNLGVIAQQVAESCPEVITIFQEAKESTEDEPAREERLGVKEQQMYWMAIKALQEAQVRIETLEAKVAALEAS